MYDAVAAVAAGYVVAFRAAGIEAAAAGAAVGVGAAAAETWRC